MRSQVVGIAFAPHCIGAAIGLGLSAGDRVAKTGPATESRFPPLQLPPGFKATLFAWE